jgi:hypothetical protein
MPRSSELPQRDTTESYPLPEVTPQSYPTPEKREQQVPIEIISGALEEIYRQEREEEENGERKRKPTLH